MAFDCKSSWLTDFFINTVWLFVKTKTAGCYSLLSGNMGKCSLFVIVKKYSWLYVILSGLLMTECQHISDVQAVQEYGKRQLSFPAIQSRTTPSSPSTGDEVLITEADLEGYVTYDNECKELSITCRRAVPARPMIARLSCLFAALKVSSGCCSHVGGRLPEIRAC